MSAAQDVVQQLILRLIHFLLNCLRTPAVIQPVLANPRRCLVRRVSKSWDTWRLFIHQLQRCTAQGNGGTVTVGKGRFESLRWESIDALKLPRYHLKLCIEFYLIANRVLVRWISLHNTNAFREHQRKVDSSHVLLSNSYKNGIFLDFWIKVWNQKSRKLKSYLWLVWCSLKISSSHVAWLSLIIVAFLFSCKILMNRTEFFFHLSSISNIIS